MKIRPKTRVYSIRMKIRPKTRMYSIKIKIRPKTRMYSIRMRIRPKTRLYSISMKIRPKTRMYSIKIKIRPKTRMYSIRMRIKPKTRVYSIRIKISMVTYGCEEFLLMTSLSVRTQQNRTTHTEGTAAVETKQSTRKLLFKRRHIVNSLIANNSRKDRVFCRFNRLCVPCGTTTTTTILYLPTLHLGVIKTRKNMCVK